MPTGSQYAFPHNFVTVLPFDSLASHSHGYKTVGIRYPDTSVGWYRKAIQFLPTIRNATSLCGSRASSVMPRFGSTDSIWARIRAAMPTLPTIIGQWSKP